MAGPYYVRSTDGSDASDGLTWANAKATLAGALAVAAAGDRIWVSQVHAETQASAMTLTSAGTAASPVEILCGNDGAEPPTALAATATVSTTGASSLVIDKSVYVYGVAFQCSSGANTASIILTNANVDHGTQVYEECRFSILGTGAGSAGIVVGADITKIRSVLWKNCIVKFGATANWITVARGADFLWNGGSVDGTGSIPAALFLTGKGGIAWGPSRTRLRGVDLSAITPGSNTLVLGATGTMSSWVFFEQCKLGASVVVASTLQAGQYVILDNCDSADTQYRMQRSENAGNVYSETTIVRTGGASDGTTPLAPQMVR